MNVIQRIVFTEEFALVALIHSYVTAQRVGMDSSVRDLLIIAMHLPAEMVARAFHCSMTSSAGRRYVSCT